MELLANDFLLIVHIHLEKYDDFAGANQVLLRCAGSDLEAAFAGMGEPAAEMAVI